MNGVRLIMWRGELAFLADRLAEVAALEVDLVLFECRHGLSPALAVEFAAMRRRLSIVRANVLAQLRVETLIDISTAGLPWRCIN